MQNSSGSSAAKFLALIPFVYLAQSRLKSVRDVGYLVATSWLPAIWILARFADDGLANPALLFAAGYLCFIAIYEIGYLANDAWDAAKATDGRRRIGFRVGPVYALVFVAIRVAFWLLVAGRLGWLSNLLWLACYAALLLAFAQHNLIRSGALRSASFFQLATLRFVLPIVASLPQEGLAPAFVAAFLFYTYFRFLSYLESKRLLTMPQRKGSWFGLAQIVILAPLWLLMSYLLSTTVIAEVGLYFTVFYAAAGLAQSRSVPGTSRQDS